MDKNQHQMAVASRLRALQQALDYSNEEMGAAIGCTKGAWSMYRLGKRPLPMYLYAAIHQRFGVMHEWIGAGVEAHRNPLELQKKIDYALRHPRPPKRGRPVKRG